MLTIKEDNNIKMKEIIHRSLRKNNIDKCEWIKNNMTLDINIPIQEEKNFLVFDGDKLIGGAIGYISYNWYSLDLLYIDERYRGQDIGTNLIKQIEVLAQKELLTGVRMETWDFQAKEFYEKLGYTVYGKIKNCPLGTTDYFLKKEL